MSAARKIQGYSSEVESGFMVLKNGPQPGMQNCTLVIHEQGHEKVYTEAEVRELLSEISEKLMRRYRGAVDQIAEKHNITL